MGTFECRIHGIVIDKDCTERLHRNGRTYFGCRPCSIERGRAYRKANRVKCNERSRLYSKANASSRKEKRITYVDNNRDLLRAAWDRYYSENSVSILEKARARSQRLKVEVFRAYSKEVPECASCREPSIDFLTLDHIGNDGSSHRAEIGSGPKTWNWAKRNEYPPLFQVLCFNCNFLKYLSVKPPSKNPRRQALEAALKRETLQMLTGGIPKCEDCPVDDVRILTVDHVHGGGNEHRRSLGMTSSQSMYSHVRKLQDKSDFAVRCYNHNSGKRSWTKPV
ncbi:MAG: hypothetical protein BWY99_01970 [Synergistetes bacterium ADurb.BinA166]|nr:MAG: hypothetical protein BWY99_01970 [Synergistetes bacterium ADurb.BinA166]